MSGIGKFTETEKSISGCQGPGVREECRTANRYEVSFWADENVLRLDNGDVVQL